jgi:hypothetical protein
VVVLVHEVVFVIVIVALVVMVLVGKRRNVSGY